MRSAGLCESHEPASAPPLPSNRHRSSLALCIRNYRGRGRGHLERMGAYHARSVECSQALSKQRGQVLRAIQGRSEPLHSRLLQRPRAAVSVACRQSGEDRVDLRRPWRSSRSRSRFARGSAIIRPICFAATLRTRSGAGSGLAAKAAPPFDPVAEGADHRPRSFQFGLTSAPMVPYCVHTMRGSNDFTARPPARRSALKIISLRHWERRTARDRTPFSRTFCKRHRLDRIVEAGHRRARRR
jgi:hypothetical protein